MIVFRMRIQDSEEFFTRPVLRFRSGLGPDMDPNSQARPDPYQDPDPT